MEGGRRQRSLRQLTDFARVSGAPGGNRTPDPLLRRYALQNSKCRFWCRLRGSASFISPLNWTEVGLKLFSHRLDPNKKDAAAKGHYEVELPKSRTWVRSPPPLPISLIPQLLFLDLTPIHF